MTTLHHPEYRDGAFFVLEVSKSDAGLDSNPMELIRKQDIR
jgi:hypothetical protein